MSLPKIQSPLFELKLPSTGEIIRYRGYKVKEEKILLIAKESADLEQAILAIIQVVNNCIVGKSVEDLPLIDVEYILLALRAKSVYNFISFTIKDPDTFESIELSLDLNNVSVTRNDQHSNKIRVSDHYTIIMKYPTLEEFKKQVEAQQTKDPQKIAIANFETMISCIDKLVSDAGEVYSFKDFSKEEIDGFIDDLSGDVIDSLKNFFRTIPKLRHEIPYTTSDGKEKFFILEGLETFFTYR